MSNKTDKPADSESGRRLVVTTFTLISNVNKVLGETVGRELAGGDFKHTGLFQRV